MPRPLVCILRRLLFLRISGCKSVFLNIQFLHQAYAPGNHHGKKGRRFMYFFFFANVCFGYRFIFLRRCTYTTGDQKPKCCYEGQRWKLFHDLVVFCIKPICSKLPLRHFVIKGLVFWLNGRKPARHHNKRLLVTS